MTTTTRTCAIIGAIIALVIPTAVFAAAAPFATTLEPTFITEVGAKLNARVSANETSDTRYWFEWGVAGRESEYALTKAGGVSSRNAVTVSMSIRGLSPERQYFFRVVAENSRGRAVGANWYFTTKALPRESDMVVIPTTREETFVTESGATIRGYLATHATKRTEWWFEWGKSTDLPNATPKRVAGAGFSAPVEVKLTALTPGTLYYYRFVAEGESGRMYGTTRAFVTRGVTPSVSPTASSGVSSSGAFDTGASSEVRRDQNIPDPEKTGTEAPKTVTTSGATRTSRTATSILPQNPFSRLFGVGNQEGEQSAAVGNAGTAVSEFFSSLSQDRAVAVAVEPLWDEDAAGSHRPIEYRISYAYRLAEEGKDARLSFILPSSVVYVGDTTNNELLVEEGAGPERTYILPIGALKENDTRTISVLGFTTEGAEGVPDVRARLSYTDASGVSHVVASVNGPLPGKNSAPSSNGILPDSLLDWALYLVVVLVAVVGIMKGKAYYEKRKAEIAAKNEEEARARERRLERRSEMREPERAIPEPPASLPGAVVVG